MAGVVSNIWRHPIKGIGCERLETVALSAGKTMPLDRVWAVTHEASRFDQTNPQWTPCNNFIRGAKAPELQAISCAVDGAGSMTLTDANHAPFTFNPDNPADHVAFIDWLAQFIPDNRAQPAALVSAPDRGMTDSDFPSISILNHSSLRALSQKAGKPVEMERFRGNIWFDGLAPWEEFDWIGKTIRIGGAELIIRERIGRCMATTVNPVTGKQDVDTLKVLEGGWDHTDFGVYGEVVKSGTINLNDTVERI